MTDDDDDRPTVHLCVDCRRRSPEVNTEYTLISAKFGWRLTRSVDRNGTPRLEWRCPECWARYKAEKMLAMTPGEGVPIARGEPSDDPKPPSSAPSSRRRGG